MNTIAISDYDVEDGSLPQNITTTMNRDRDRNNLKESEENNKKVRAPRPKLDFNRLLKGNRGLGYLAVCTRKSLKLSGKPGNEAQDLSQIVVYLQEWAKLVFPKMNLIEFLLKVEEICQSRIMKVQLKACVPEILERIKAMGDDVNLNDLEEVESEILTKMATDQAERALEELSNRNGNRNGNNLNTNTTNNNNNNNSIIVPPNGSTTFDFDLDQILKSKSPKRRNKNLERSEFNEDLNSEFDENEGLDSKELDDFINDNSESENEKKSLTRIRSSVSFLKSNYENENEDSDSLSDSEKSEKLKLTKKPKREISFNFEDSNSNSNSNSESELELNDKKNYNMIIDEDKEEAVDQGIGTEKKKTTRSAVVIQESSSSDNE